MSIYPRKQQKTESPTKHIRDVWMREFINELNDDPGPDLIQCLGEPKTVVMREPNLRYNVIVFR